MRKLILTTLLFSSIILAGQDKFNQSIQQLGTDLEYFPKSESGNKNYANKSSVIEWFKKTKKYCVEYDPKIKAINFNEFIAVKSTEVKSKKPLSGKTYLRVTIEEWTFENEANAKEFENKFEQINIECLNKGGIEFWRVKENFYLIVSPATLFSYEFVNIKKSLNKKLL